MEGIVVGCDRHQEWLLPWWWSHYSAMNGYPVLFVDFGMTGRGKAWCRERGLYAVVDEIAMHPVSAANKTLWESQITSILDYRGAFFKKPLAMRQSPFPLSLWLDLDCQVRGPLAPLFYLLHFGVELSVRTIGEGCSAAVVAFRRDSELLQQWVDEVKMRNDRYIHDEPALYSILKNAPFMELPEIYNWNPLHGINQQAVIVHHQGGFLKDEIRKSLSSSPL